MLELKNISYKKDNKIILNNINLNIKNNSLIVITGPNGSGKSSLAKIIMGINEVSNGKIIFNSVDITKYSVDKRARLGISYAFQTPVNFKGLKVIDLFKTINKNIKFNEVKKYLSLVGLCTKDYIDRKFDDSLSGGEKKRLEIALILYKNGIINIYDEPEAGIDLWSFDKLVDIFKHKSKNITIIISHQEKILSLANQVILLNKGEIINVYNKDEINKLTKEKTCKLCGDYDE